MAASNLLALIDDIATILDDVALMSKLAVKKTAGVLGDDLALNAQQVTGVTADRELPVVWAVAKGSFINKVILVPSALLISIFVPWAITPLLMVGGLFLCFEGSEKIIHKLFTPEHEERAHQEKLREAVIDETVDLVQFEKDKIKGAVRTDFILSAEIVVLTLGTLTGQTLIVRVLTLSAIGLLMTVGVYGLVAGIVKLDDVGLRLQSTRSSLNQKLGAGLVWSAPVLMKFLGVAGTVAMFMVGGGIVVHGVPWLHHHIEPIQQPFGIMSEIGVGLVCGTAIALVVKLIAKLRS